MNVGARRRRTKSAASAVGRAFGIVAPRVEVVHADVMAGLRSLPDESVHCCVTSPPYWGLRDYGIPGQLGLEDTPDEYVARLVEVFREVRRVLVKDGTLWLNLGDSFANSPGAVLSYGTRREHARRRARQEVVVGDRQRACSVLKPKDLIGVPWRVAFALQADGWWLRQDIVWQKPNPLPESVRDRCTKAHEYLFLLAKSDRYYFDVDAIKEPGVTGKWAAMPPIGGVKHAANEFHGGRIYSGKRPPSDGLRQRRSVWLVPVKPFKGAHFAVMPPKLIEPCVLAGSPAGGTVLDPFAGSGTTLAVAVASGRSAVGIELNEEYLPLIRSRIEDARRTASLFLSAEDAESSSHPRRSRRIVPDAEDHAEGEATARRRRRERRRDSR